MPRFEGEVIELRAVAPDGDIACDTTIATADARSGLAEALARGIVRPVRKLENGVEVTFRSEARDAVLRYADLESRCCSFLDLAVRMADGVVILTVTGRPEARDWIYNIFEEQA
jgi:hypothetical protein